MRLLKPVGSSTSTNHPVGGAASSTPEGSADGPAVVLHLEFCENYGDLIDYLAEYEDGKMTAEAKAIYEA
ncbi:MAG: hypothetical protein JW918_19690, partial [Anaerolineae bacterium]|nr:hypothetical protein [Anaerolineae bacterium]